MTYACISAPAIFFSPFLKRLPSSSSPPACVRRIRRTWSLPPVTPCATSPVAITHPSGATSLSGTANGILWALCPLLVACVSQTSQARDQQHALSSYEEAHLIRRPGDAVSHHRDHRTSCPWRRPQPLEAGGLSQGSGQPSAVPFPPTGVSPRPLPSLLILCSSHPPVLTFSLSLWALGFPRSLWWLWSSVRA